MDRNAILEKIVSVTSESLDVDPTELTEMTDFKQLGADSFDLLELVTAFEDEFGLTLPDEQLENIVTISDAVDAVLAAQ